jgi:hypothetical protein
VLDTFLPLCYTFDMATKQSVVKELRLKYPAGSPLDKMVDRLQSHFGIDKPAVLQMALKKLSDATFGGAK